MILILYYFFENNFDQNLIQFSQNQIDSYNFSKYEILTKSPIKKNNFLHKMTTDDEDVAEKLPKTTQNSQQTAENVNGDQNELFGAPLAIRRRRVRGSRSNSSSRTKKKMSKGIDIEQMEMGRATLIASLLLLAGICAIHLLLVAENPNEFIAKNTNGIVAHFGRPLPRSIDHQIYPKFKNRADKFVQNQLEKLASDLEQLHTNLDELTSRLPFRVNMLLTEQRRRNTVQRPRSATPIPANLPMTANRPTRHSARHPNSMSNSENWSPPPPQQMAEASTSEDQNQFGEIGEEPTLMDYDAIDAYWRWDIEQEKGPASVLMQQPYQYPYPYNHFQQFVEPQQQQQWTPPNAQQNDESAEMFLYERDIQLLTEKTQFPELSIFGETVNDDANLPTNALEEDEYLLADISQTKWEMPPQWPTTSSEEESAQFGLENNGNGGDDHGILWTTQRLGKLLPFQAGIGPELLNIPVVTPPPTAVDFEDPQQNVPPIGAEEEAPISSNSCEQFSPTQISFIPSPQTTSAEHPILFNDVSLAEATIINSADGQIDTSNSEFADPLPSTTQFQSQIVEPEKEEEEDDEMLLSTLFPQLFHQPIPNGPDHNLGSPLQIQRSLSMNSADRTNPNLEVILRELATAELLLNASNLAAAAAISPQLSPLQIPLTIQTPAFHQQQAYSPSSIPPMMHQNQQQSPLLDQNSLSPILEQFNQTQQLMNVPSSSSATGFSSLFASAPDHDFYGIPQNQISARCSSTTSSGFGSSGADTLASTSPSFAFGNGQQNSPSFRYENKLVPKTVKMTNGKGSDVGPRENSGLNGMERPKAKGKRGRRSKDDSLVNQHGLPYSAEQLAAMPYREYATLMADGRLTSEQKTMIKKIRRRGRNKLAARKCRERRLNPKEEEGEEEEEFEEDDDQIIDVVGHPMGYEEDYNEVKEDESNISSSLDNFYEDEMKYEPAGISLYPSTSAASNSQQQMMVPSKMRSGRNIQRGTGHQTNKPTTIRVQF